MRNVVSSLVVFMASLFAFAVPRLAQGAEYFVGGPNASDGNPGSRDAPFANLGFAATKLNPGDIVNIRGTHNMTGNGVYVGRSGTAGAPIIFRSAPGEMGKITGKGVQDFKAPLTLAGNHLQVRDLEIGESDGFGILVYRASNIELVGNTIHDAYRQGVMVFAEEGVPWPADILIENNKVFRNARENMARNKNGGWPGAISTQRADRLKLINNTIYENWGEGIVFNLTNGSIARGNTVYDNFSANLYMDHARNCTFEKNFVYTTGNQQFLRNLNDQWSPASGVQMANEDYGGSSNPLANNKVINNIVVGGGWGFFYGRYGVGGGMKQTVVANNTFVRATREMIHIDQDGHTGAVFANNIFSLEGGAMTQMPGGASGITFKNNLWQGGASGPAGGPGDVAADPQLANRNGRTAVDFRIAAGSPARGKGTALTEVADDFWAGARSSPPDIGAHQQGAASPGGTGGATGTGGTPGTGGMMAAQGGTGGKGAGGNVGQAGGGTNNVGGGGNINNNGASSGNGGDANTGGTSMPPKDEEPQGPQLEGCSCELGRIQPRTGALAWLTMLMAVVLYSRKSRR